MSDDYEMSIGTSIGFDDEPIQDNVRIRRLSGGESATKKALTKMKMKNLVGQMVKQTPKIVPPAVEAVIKKQGVRNPAGLVKALALGPMVVAAAQAKAMNQAKTVQNAGKMELRKAEADLSKAVKSGAITPTEALKIREQKRNEIVGKQKTAMAAIKQGAQQSVAQAKMKQLNAYKAVLKSRDNKVDAAERKTRNAMQKVKGALAQKKMGPKTAAVMMKMLKQKERNLAAGRKILRANKGIAQAKLLAKAGVFTPKQAKNAIANMKKAKAASKKKAIIAKKVEPSKDKIQARMFKIMRAIKMFETAIKNADALKSSWVVIPRTKKGSQVVENRYSVKDAKVRLEKLKMAYKKLGGQLVKLGMKPMALPKKVTVKAVDRKTRKPVSPDTIKAQIAYIEKLMKDGKLDRARGETILKQLRGVLDAMGKPKIVPGVGKPGAKPTTVVVNLDISKAAQAQVAKAGEKVVATAPGPAKTRGVPVGPAIPTAIPHAVVGKPAMMTGKPTPMFTARPPKRVSLKRKTVSVPLDPIYSSLAPPFLPNLKIGGK